MAGNLIGEPFKSYVNEQIKARQKVHGKTERTLEEISYLNSRNAWIKMASGVTLSADKYNDVTKDIDTPSLGKNQDDDGGLLAKNWVLFNGLGKPKNSNSIDEGNVVNNISATNPILGDRAGIGGNGAYGIGGTEFGYSPMPGIADASLKCLNRGSIKKMEVNVIAHNTNQFNVIDTLYLRLGYSVFIEWGYDKYLDNNGDLQPMGPSLIDEKFFSDDFGNSNYSKWIPEIEKKRKKTDGNYEGIFGTISNFSWTFQDDGSYKIKIEIISLGDIVESLRANLPPVGEISSAYTQFKIDDLKQNVFIGGKAASQDDFYNILFPGLKSILGGFYTKAYNDYKNNTYVETSNDEKGTILSGNFVYTGLGGGDAIKHFLNLPNFNEVYYNPGDKEAETTANGFLEDGIWNVIARSMRERPKPITSPTTGKTTPSNNYDIFIRSENKTLSISPEESNEEGFFAPPNYTDYFFPKTVKGERPLPNGRFKDTNGYLIDQEQFLKYFYEYALDNNVAGGSTDIRFYPTTATITDRESNKNRITKYFATIRKAFDNPPNGIKQLWTLKGKSVFTIIGGVQVQNPSGTRFPITDKEFELFNASVNFPKFSSSSPEKYNNSFCYMNGLTGYFIKLGTFLDYLQEFIIPKIDKGDQPMMTIDTNEKNNICYVVDNVVSLNPKKIQINNSDFLTYSNGYIEINQGLSPFKQKEGKYIYGNIMNIYFSFDRIEEIFDDIDSDGNISIYNVIKKICQDINETLGFTNNIEPVISDTNEKGKVIGNVIKLIDQTPIPGIEIISRKLGFKPPKKEAILEVFGYNSKDKTSTFVNKIGITTEINKRYATMITIGATSQGSIPGVEATSFSKWNEGITDRFKNKLVDAVATTTKTDPLENIIEQNKNVYGEYTEYLKQSEGLFGYNTGEEGSVNDKIVSTNSKVASNFYKYQASYSSLSNSNKDGAISSVGFMPFNLKLDMDGLGGIKIYNRLQVNTSFLPPNYGNSLQFIVTGVNHKISNNSWTTHLDTLATSKPQTIPEILAPTEKLIVTGSFNFEAIKASCVKLVVTGSFNVPDSYDGVPLENNIKVYSKVSTPSEYKNDILPIINGADYKANYTFGHRIIAAITTKKEGYYAGSIAYTTKNPGNIGNTDSGLRNPQTTVIAGMKLLMDYYSSKKAGTGYTGTEAIWNFGEQEIKPNFSKEIQKNQSKYRRPNGCLPGYKGNYQGQISYFVKRYSTASRINNNGLSIYATLFALNGYSGFTGDSTFKDLMDYGGISNKDVVFQ